MLTELKEPVKIPIPKFDRTQKPATATSPVRSSARPSQPSATALVAMATARSPAKASLSLPLHPLSKPALMHPSLTAAAGLKRKSTSSRREELLMQLKAVEDAIAKKRSKMQWRDKDTSLAVVIVCTVTAVITDRLDWFLAVTEEHVPSSDNVLYHCTEQRRLQPFRLRLIHFVNCMDFCTNWISW